MKQRTLPWALAVLCCGGTAGPWPLAAAADPPRLESPGKPGLVIERDGPPSTRPEDRAGPAPGPDHFYIPGQYVPSGTGVTWRPGFWTRSQPGWEWMPARWLRRSEGWVYREGHWERSESEVASLDPPRRHVVARPVPASTGPFGPDPALSANPNGAPGPSARRTPVAVAVEQVQPCVVSITSQAKAASDSRWPFTADENQQALVTGMGTGVILDGRGYILTNHHVVDKVQGIEVHLSDGTSYPARLLQFDPAMDLAMLKIDADRRLQAIKIGTSHDLMVGESVITIGNAFGYENTVAVGIVSALKRNISLDDGYVYRNLIQTDAAINPGNSGGPLINLDAELVGINVAVRAGAQGIGFALPIDEVKGAAAELMSTRRLARTWHGLVAGEVHSAASRAVVLAEVQGGSPAEVAGFRPGDQVVQVGELVVTTVLDIERGLLDVPPGRPTRVVVRRAGLEQALDLEMRPLTAPPAPVARVAPIPAGDPALPRRQFPQAPVRPAR